VEKKRKVGGGDSGSGGGGRCLAGFLYFQIFFSFSDSAAGTLTMSFFFFSLLWVPLS
jgi:hypothetical protein